MDGLRQSIVYNCGDKLVLWSLICYSYHDTKNASLFYTDKLQVTYVDNPCIKGNNAKN